MRKNEIKVLLPYILITILILFINTKVLLFSYIPSASMEPTIKTGSLVVNTRVFQDIEREDIIVFEQDDVYMIKRVIGLPGETLEIRENEIYIDGEKLTCDYIKEPMDTEDMKIKIPKDSYYVMGDNRNNSADSRTYGPIHVSKIKAKKL